MTTATPSRTEHHPDDAEAVPVTFPGVALRIARHHLLLESDRELTMLSSAPYGGGLRRGRRILSSHVPKDVDCSRPGPLLRARAAQLGIVEPFVGLLTAVDLRRGAIDERASGDLRLLTVVTAGTGNASNASRPPRLSEVRPGTINIVTIADGCPSHAALVNMVLTATEAKTLALLDAGVVTRDGLPASGTSSDAIVVGHTGRGRRLAYAGPATKLGALIGESVYAAVRAGVEREGAALS